MSNKSPASQRVASEAAALFIMSGITTRIARTRTSEADPEKKRCSGQGKVVAWPRVGGLHRRYDRAAWIWRHPSFLPADQLIDGHAICCCLPCSPSRGV